MEFTAWIRTRVYAPLRTAPHRTQCERALKLPRWQINRTALLQLLHISLQRSADARGEKLINKPLILLRTINGIKAPLNLFTAITTRPTGCFMYFFVLKFLYIFILMYFLSTGSSWILSCAFVIVKVITLVVFSLRQPDTYGHNKVSQPVRCT